MAGSVNKVILVGRLGRDPETRYTANQTAITRFSVATSEFVGSADRSGGSGQDRQEKTQWHNIVAWGKLAETCKNYLAKGRLVYIEGRLETREYTDRDGNKRKSTEVVARDMPFLESRGQSEPRGDYGTPASSTESGSGGDFPADDGFSGESDLPF